MRDGRPTSLRQANAERTRTRIVDAVVALMAERGDAELTMPAVSAASGVSLRTLYRYFPTRQALVDAVAAIGDQTVATGLPTRELSIDDAGPWLREAWGGLLQQEAFIRAQHTSPNGADIRRSRIPLFRAVTWAVLLRDQPSLERLPAERVDALVDVVLLLTSSAVLLELVDVLELDLERAADLAGAAVAQVATGYLAQVEGPVVTFRPLVDDDLPMLTGWLAEPGVVRWWEGDDVSPEGVSTDDGSDQGPDQVEHWVALVAGEPVGWLRCYPTAAESPEEMAAWRPHGVDDGVAGIDYLVADAAHRGQGLGSAMIRAFVVGVVFLRHPQWTQAAAAPDVANAASWRALEKAGFRHRADIPADPGDDDGPSRLMVIDRSDVTIEPPTR